LTLTTPGKPRVGLDWVRFNIPPNTYRGTAFYWSNDTTISVKSTEER